jgi:uncharacterized protein YndB with AHSA1/START domain
MSITDTAAEATLVIRRTFAAPRERVYAAWTDPVIMSRWFAPGEATVRDVVFDAREGATYRIVMAHADGELFVVGGTVRELRRPERIVWTFQWEDDNGVPEGTETLLTVDFHERGESTELVLTQVNFTDLASRDRHEGGWTLCLDKLATVL